ncbi:MAG: FAD-dependent monooxygenase [Bacteriovoracaceae bacterium]|nr:FAD-dependent monooxygenase [Bacteriovoracaceae bacterium]
MSEQPKKIIISGAGLVGSLLAIGLKKRGHDVTLFEKRPDMRKNLKDQGRSINLIVTAKGIKTLASCNLWDAVKEITVPVNGRMMHSIAGEMTYQPYGKDDSECNYSISRGELNVLLMNKAEEAGVKIHFNSPLLDISLSRKCAYFDGHNCLSYDHLFGTDGAGSPTRDALIEKMGDKATFKMHPLGADYKEMQMPSDPNGDYSIEKNALHIWPRGNHMLMALPNQGGSFTMTLYMPTDWYEKYKTPESVEGYFKEFYPDAIPLMPNFKKDFLENPQGFLGTVRMNPWVYEDQVALLGDAAHAIVPFFGQGMNSGFSDIQYLLDQVDKNKDDWKATMTSYQDHQKLNGDAVADLSLENFTEMCDKVGDENFLFRKKVEHKIENSFPSKYRSRYAMVTYTLIPYHKVVEAGKIQSKILDEVCKGISSPDELNLDLTEKLIDEKLTPWFKQEGIKLERYHL